MTVFLLISWRHKSFFFANYFRLFKCIFWLELYIVSLVILVSSRVTNHVLNMKRSCPQWGFFQKKIEFERILNLPLYRFFAHKIIFNKYTSWKYCYSFLVCQFKSKFQITTENLFNPIVIYQSWREDLTLRSRKALKNVL